MPSPAEAPGVTVAIAHEWLVVYAGSERCVEQIRAEFPGARILTTLVAPGGLPPAFAGAEPSVLQRIPGATSHHEHLVPLMPLAWRLRRPVDGVDAVVSSSHACAKGVRVAPGVAHVCYCHTPMRYAWEYDLERSRFPRWQRPMLAPLMAGLRRWDRGTAARVDAFVANSRDVAGRIREHYGRDARVVHPPVDTGYFTPGGERGDHFLYTGRLVAYKRPDLVVEAFRDLPRHRLVVVGRGPMEAALRARATPNVEFAGGVPDEALRDLYRTARAVIFPGHEDFGIVMAEALACGTPVIALARGGALDIVEPGRSGWLMPRQDVASLRAAVAEAAADDPDAADIAASAGRFGRERYRREMRAVVEETVAAVRR
jgi:glycosyltransferase involved in cell wall biosynthesis